MADEKVYGIAESKSKAEVYSKENADGQFAAKTDLNNYAIKNHATNQTTYGLGSSSQYGHVKIVDDYSGSSSGLAFSAAAAKTLKSRVSTLEAKAYIPVGCVGISYDTSVPYVFNLEMGYGTWEYLGDIIGKKWHEDTQQYVDTRIGSAFKRNA